MDKAQVLIVEDEGIVAKDLAQRIRAMGHGVIAIASSGPDAIQKVADAQPHLVLMDIHLRGEMDGIAVASRIRDLADIPIVYLTAHADTATVERAKITEPFGYILKPFEERELQIAIEMALYKHRMEKALAQQRADFLAMLTHDIKSPLTVILGCADLLTQEIRGHGLTQAEALLSTMQSSAESIYALVTNFLDLATIKRGTLNLPSKAVVVNDLIRQLEQRYEAEARRRHLSLDLHLQEALPMIAGNPLALERVFANLLYNALKFTPEGGRVTLSSGQQEGMVVIAVTDTGPGIAQEEIPALFEKYQRAEKDQHREGTGLGLFIAKTLVTELGGRIELESTLGTGSRFSVFLPAMAAG